MSVATPTPSPELAYERPSLADPVAAQALFTPEALADLQREVARLRTAVELGKWPDGSLLTEQQRELCMQAVIMWESCHLDQAQRTGFIDRGSKAEGELCDDPQPLVIRDLDQ